MSTSPITLLYDGGCPICVQEMTRGAQERMRLSRAFGVRCAGDRCSRGS